MRTLYVTSEAFPLAKTGGLADVSAALPRALRDLGCDVRILLPGYPQAIDRASQVRPAQSLGNLIGGGEARLLDARMPDTGIPVWLVDCPILYDRPGGLYQDGGLAPLLLSLETARRPATIFTIHNLAYQGLYPLEEIEHLHLEKDKVYSDVEFFGRMSFIKAGIATADALTTVSPTYAKEILAYSPSDMAGRLAAKKAIQEEFGLPPSPTTPLIGAMSRLDYQKMPDIVAEALPALLDEGLQFAMVAEGDPIYESQFRELARRYPDQVAVALNYEEPRAHRLLAGADILLHPSRHEPCGLSPIYALRYGTLPVVRRCGGMADSIVDASSEALQSKRATGFVFDDCSVTALTQCARRALEIYRQPIAWRTRPG
jgi:starch synthase